MTELLRLLISLSLAGGVLTVLGLGLNALLRGRVPHRFRYYLWLLVLVRFVCPVGGGEGLLGHAMAQEPAVRSEEVLPGPPDAVLRLEDPAESEGKPSGSTWAWPAAVLWIGGALAVLGYRWMGYRRLCRQLDREAMEARPWEQEALLRLGGTGRPLPRLLRSGAAASPVLVGVVHPRLYLPLEPVPSHALEGVLRHELTHWRRKDLLYKWAVWGVTGLHWFNPMVWLLSRAVERDCELSCDEAVAASLTRAERLTYGRALLWAADREMGGAELTAPLWNQKQCLTERLKTIMRPIHTSPKARCLLTGAAALLLMASVALGAYAGQGDGEEQGREGSAPQAILSQREGSAPTELAWPFQSDGEIAVTRLFGTRVHPITGATTHHEGIDIRLEEGTPVLAAAGGVVIETAFDPIDGQYLVLEHGGGLTTTYCSLSGDGLAQVGRQVKAGETLGTVGSTGTSTGSHLHFEVAQDGTPVDPLDLLPYRGGPGDLAEETDGSRS